MRTLAAIAILLPAALPGQRKALDDSIARRADATWAVARKIWTWSEPGYQETKSAALLAKNLEDAGFDVQRGVAEIPTAFVAVFGKGRPVLGILGEYDALPGLSQTDEPARKRRRGASYGHACGHHLFGAASMSAAIAVAEQIAAGNLQGTVRFYGCPAEEGGAAKVFMTRAGLFDDCDAVLHWHPAGANSAGDASCLARIAAKFRFRGKSAHAAGAPEQGRSALDAVELTNHAAQLMREHTPDGSRIHHVITNGGAAPNVVPGFAEVYYYVRHLESSIARELYRRLLLCAKAGALATETKLEVEYLGGTMEILPNETLSRVVLRNLRQKNDLTYTAGEAAFAKKIASTLAKPKPIAAIRDVTDRSGTVTNGSTDVGDITWVVPTAGFRTVCWAPGTPAHSWQAVAAGGTSIGRKGMNLAARVLAATAWDLYKSPETLAAAKSELQRRLGDEKYESLLEPGQKPPLDYRKPSRAR